MSLNKRSYVHDYTSVCEATKLAQMCARACKRIRASERESALFFCSAGVVMWVSVWYVLRVFVSDCACDGAKAKRHAEQRESARECEREDAWRGVPFEHV